MSKNSDQLHRGTYYSVAALAAATLMLESTLTRLLAVAQYYHFAFLVVSLALLGFGASGSLLTLFPGWKREEKKTAGGNIRARIIHIAGFGLAASLSLAYVVVNWLPFDSYSITWDSKQVLYFALYYLVLTLPFLFAGLGIGAVLSSSPGKNNRVYAVNLLGSAFGILLGLFVMQLAGVPGALIGCGVVGLSAVLGTRKLPGIHRTAIWVVMAAGAAGVMLLGYTNAQYQSSIGITISPYKGLPYARQVPGSESLFGSWNAISRIDVISGASTHVMPGLSYTYGGELPDQTGMAFDGDALRPVTLVDPENFQAGAYLPEAGAFELHPGGKVLVLDAGSGLGLMQAIAGGAGEVTAVVEDPLILQAITKTSPSHDIYSHEAVQTAVEPIREYLAKDTGVFDLVLMPLNEPYRPVANGAYSLAEDYALTVEAIAAGMTRLNPGGTLVATRWLQTPPSEELRFLATLIEALSKLEVEGPEDKLVAYRGIQTMTYILRPGGWTSEQIDHIRAFTDLRRFDLVWMPGINLQDTNRYNRLSEPVYYQLFDRMLGADDLKSFYADYAYAIHPATDNQPFFFHFFKWAQTPQALATFGRVWQPFGGSGYFVLIALLLLVFFFSLVLIVVPLLVWRRNLRKSPPSIVDEESASVTVPAWKVLAYFGSIGIAFLFIEIPLIQTSMLSLEHAAYAFGFVVLILLVSSSLGSYLARRFWGQKIMIFLVLIGLAALVPIIFRNLQYTSLGWPLWLRVTSLGVSLVPLGIVMGFPFPFGLQWLERAEPHLTTWAWAVNGCASVVAAVLAAIISLSVGFSVVLFLGVSFYVMAALILR